MSELETRDWPFFPAARHSLGSLISSAGAGEPFERRLHTGLNRQIAHPMAASMSATVKAAENWKSLPPPTLVISPPFTLSFPEHVLFSSCFLRGAEINDLQRNHHVFSGKIFMFNIPAAVLSWLQHSVFTKSEHVSYYRLLRTGYRRCVRLRISVWQLSFCWRIARRSEVELSYCLYMQSCVGLSFQFSPESVFSPRPPFPH